MSCEIEIVAGVITDGELYGLVRRSRAVGSDQGLWHCVTGFLEANVSPRDQILEELYEELNLQESEIVELKQASSITIVEDETRWVIHTFLVVTEITEFKLNWENNDFCWIECHEDKNGSVSWLKHVLATVRSLNRIR